MAGPTKNDSQDTFNWAEWFNFNLLDLLDHRRDFHPQLSGILYIRDAVCVSKKIYKTHFLFNYQMKKLLLYASFWTSHPGIDPSYPQGQCGVLTDVLMPHKIPPVGTAPTLSAWKADLLTFTTWGLSRLIARSLTGIIIINNMNKTKQRLHNTYVNDVILHPRLV